MSSSPEPSPASRTATAPIGPAPTCPDEVAVPAAGHTLDPDRPVADHVEDGLDRRGPSGRARLPVRQPAHTTPAPAPDPAPAPAHSVAAPPVAAPPVAAPPVAAPPVAAAPSADHERPTAALWRRRAPGTSAVACAVALTGIDQVVLADALSISLASSPEAQHLLDGMELRVRTLTTSVESETERCIYAVRGPVMWSETLTARANALGNDDVFVCATPSRSFDTVENRVLVASLEAIARAAKALSGPTGAKVPPEDAARILAVAEEARRWRRHPRLAEVRSTRLNGRDMARLRKGHRSSRMGPVIAVRDRVNEPFLPEDLDGLSDRWTRRYHAFVLFAVDALVERFGEPAELSISDRRLVAGAIAFRHPAAPGGGSPGLTYRGIPLLPPADVVEGAPWSARLPSDGVRLAGEGGLRRFVDRLSAHPQGRRPRGA